METRHRGPANNYPPFWNKVYGPFSLSSQRLFRYQQSRDFFTHNNSSIRHGSTPLVLHIYIYIYTGLLRLQDTRPYQCNTYGVDPWRMWMDEMGWDGMGWDGMGWDGMGWM